MKILVTAFEPFGGEKVNPAQEAVAKIDARSHGAEIVKVSVPVVFGEAIDTVYAAMKAERPDVVLCIGQAGGRSAVTPERVAINVNDAGSPDNNGNQPVDEPIFEDGAAAYFSTLPIKRIVERVRAAGLPASVSNSAGTYVCNNLMYGVLYYIEKEFPGVRGGFVHVPYLHEQVLSRMGVPSLSLEDMVKAIDAVIAAIAE